MPNGFARPRPSPGMSRRAPEFALLIGLVLALAYVGFVALVSGGAALLAPRQLVGTVAVALVLSYPFAIYAVHYDDDPTTVLPPVAVGLAGGLVAALVAVAGAVAGVPVEAALVALLAGLPVGAYVVTYGGLDLPDARAVAAVGVLCGVGVVLAGLVVGPASLAAVAGLLCFLAAAAYHDHVARVPLAPERGLAAGLLLAGVVAAAGLGLSAATFAVAVSALAPLAGGVGYAYGRRLLAVSGGY